MVALRSSRLIPPLAGLAAALLSLAMPATLLEQASTMSDLPVLLPAAAPPLGWIARALAAGAVGAGCWAALFLLLGRRPARGAGVPVLRRADAHPDAPARRPLFAAEDLGEPLGPELALPTDLDRLLADFDPEAMPAEPREPVQVLPSLARPAPLAPGERLRTFAPAEPRASAEPASLDALLGRLEQGARRVARPARPPVPGGSLEEAIASLQRVARRA